MTLQTTLAVYDAANGETAATPTWWDGTKEQGATATYVPNGRKVADLLTKPFVIAHRCGSADWAEHSMRGATESVVRGVDGLEFSIGSSSDGVLFGLHDQTLNRTTPSAPANYIASNHTWEEISAYQEVAPSGGDPAFGPQPYTKLTDLLNTYAGTHLILLDPKYVSSAKYGALLDIMDSYPQATQHLMGKFYGTGISWANACKARGYKSWGYFYAADIDSGTVTSANTTPWDYLGMEYNAAASYWTTIRSYGKPVIAHIAPTLAAAQQGIASGAVGVMASGIRSVMAGSLTG